MQRFVFSALALGALLLAHVPAVLGQDAKKKGDSQLDDGKKAIAITVLVPRADAMLTVDGMKMKERGLARKFVTPKLDVKGVYNYTLVVEWEPNNYTKITCTQK